MLIFCVHFTTCHLPQGTNQETDICHNSIMSEQNETMEEKEAFLRSHGVTIETPQDREAAKAARAKLAGNWQLT